MTAARAPLAPSSRPVLRSSSAVVCSVVGAVATQRTMPRTAPLRGRSQSLAERPGRRSRAPYAPRGGPLRSRRHARIELARNATGTDLYLGEWHAPRMPGFPDLGLHVAGVAVGPILRRQRREYGPRLDSLSVVGTRAQAREIESPHDREATPGTQRRAGRRSLVPQRRPRGASLPTAALQLRRGALVRECLRGVPGVPSNDLL